MSTSQTSGRISGYQRGTSAHRCSRCSWRSLLRWETWKDRDLLWYVLDFTCRRALAESVFNYSDIKEADGEWKQLERQQERLLLRQDTVWSPSTIHPTESKKSNMTVGWKWSVIIRRGRHQTNFHPYSRKIWDVGSKQGLSSLSVPCRW